MPTTNQRVPGIVTGVVCACLATEALGSQGGVRVTVEVVQGAAEEPLRSGEVTLISRAGGRRVLRPGPSGRFDPVHLAPGQYRIRAAADGCIIRIGQIRLKRFAEVRHKTIVKI